MNVKINFGVLPVFLTLSGILAAQPHPIDVQKSGITVRVFKAGMFSALGHDHEIAPAIAAGTVDITSRRVDLRFSAAALRVRDPCVSDKHREEVQKTILGPPVTLFSQSAQTLTGTVSDSICGAKRMRTNVSAAQCTHECVKRGSDYALVTNGKVYTRKGEAKRSRSTPGRAQL